MCDSCLYSQRLPTCFQGTGLAFDTQGGGPPKGAEVELVLARGYVEVVASLGRRFSRFCFWSFNEPNDSIDFTA